MIRRLRLEVGGLVVGVLILLAGWALVVRDEALREIAPSLPGASAFAIGSGQGLHVQRGKSGAVRLAAIIADRGSAVGVRLSVKPLMDMVASGFAAVDLDVRGDEASLRAFSRAVEGERPIIRFVRWSIRPAADGRLRLTARAVAPMMPAR